MNLVQSLHNYKKKNQHAFLKTKYGNILSEDLSYNFNSLAFKKIKFQSYNQNILFFVLHDLQCQLTLLASHKNNNSTMSGL